jgi:DNA (cytosine-5)-methyltransferase 1
LGIDSDAHAFAAHKLNFPNARHSQADVSQLTGAEVMRLADAQPNSVDGVIGGPPCQGFSRIGRRDATDPRNSLFCKFFDIVRDVRPRFFLAENVPGIMDKVYDELRERALVSVSDYMCLEPFEVSASDFGAPTSRKRVLFVGYRRDAFAMPLTAAAFLSPAQDTEICVRDALSGLPRKIKDRWLSDEDGWRVISRRPVGAFWDRVFDSIPEGVGDPKSIRRLRQENRVSGCVATNHTNATRLRFANLEAGEVDPVSRARRLDPLGVCPTIRAGTARDKGSYQAVRPIHPWEARVITPREAARLQGFPDWFRFAPTKWHSFRQIGNSVSPILGEALLRIVKERLVGGGGSVTTCAASFQNVEGEP